MQIVTDKNKVALYYKNEAVTYKEFILNTKKIKQFTKIKEFTNNMIYMENRPELLYSFFAIWDSRATCVCIDASSTAEEMTYYIDNSDVAKILSNVNITPFGFPVVPEVYSIKAVSSFSGELITKFSDEFSSIFISSNFIPSIITISICLFKILKASFTFSTCILEVNILTTSELSI